VLLGGRDGQTPGKDDLPQSPDEEVEMTEPSDHSTAVVRTRAQQRFASWTSDVLVYIVVLNLFVEFVDAIVIDSFWISILTAVLLKLLLDAVIGVEHRVAAFFKASEGPVNTVLGWMSQFSILFLSKLLILEVVNFVFGDHVELGHFIEIVALIVAMIVARRVLQSVYERLGEAPR
jgi:hypothetical protein